MRILLKILSVLSLLFLISISPAQDTGYLKSKTEIIQSANTVIQVHISKKNNTKHVIKVVYFHAADKEPLPNWKERLNVTLQDVSLYYKEELAKYGIQSNGIPFE